MPGWWNWYTRTSQKRMPHSLRVRVSLRALMKNRLFQPVFLFYKPIALTPEFAEMHFGVFSVMLLPYERLRLSLDIHNFQS